MLDHIQLGREYVELCETRDALWVKRTKSNNRISFLKGKFYKLINLLDAEEKIHKLTNEEIKEISDRTHFLTKVLKEI